VGDDQGLKGGAGSSSYVDQGLLAQHPPWIFTQNLPSFTTCKRAEGAKRQQGISQGWSASL
jgi:hypothetical protein